MSTWADWRSRWSRLSRREQGWLLWGVALTGAALLWRLALAPALDVLRTADVQRERLQQQVQQMQQLQARARQLQALPSLNADEARRALEQAVQSLGAQAGMTVQMQQVQVQLKALAPGALAQWLASVRQNAHLLPTEAHLQRNGDAWNGTLTFTLPGA